MSAVNAQPCTSAGPLQRSSCNICRPYMCVSLQEQCELCSSNCAGANPAKRDELASAAAASLAGHESELDAHELAARIFCAPALPRTAAADARPGLHAVPSPAALAVMDALVRLEPDADLRQDVLDSLPVATLVAQQASDVALDDDRGWAARLAELLACEAVELQTSDIVIGDTTPSAQLQHIISNLPQSIRAANAAALTGERDQQISKQESAAMSRLRHLSLANSSSGISAAAAAFMGHGVSPLLLSLTFLSLRNVPLQGTALQFEAHALPHLQHLDLGWSGTWQAADQQRALGAHCVASIGHLTTLTALDLSERLGFEQGLSESTGKPSDAARGEQSSYALAMSQALSKLCALQHLDISYNQMTHADCAALYDSILPRLPMLTSLVWHNGGAAGDAVAVAVLATCMNASLTSLRHLDLSDPRQRDDVQAPPAAVCKGNSTLQLTALLLGGRRIGEASLRLVLKSAPRLRLLEGTETDLGSDMLKTLGNFVCHNRTCQMTCWVPAGAATTPLQLVVVTSTGDADFTSNEVQPVALPCTCMLSALPCMTKLPLI